MKQERQDPAEVRNRVAQIMKQYVRAELPAGELVGGADIRDYGVDSIEAMEMFAEIESEFGVRLGEEEIDFTVLNNLDAITSLVVKKV